MVVHATHTSCAQYIVLVLGWVSYSVSLEQELLIPHLLCETSS